jgi:hypothetical protein
MAISPPEGGDEQDRTDFLSTQVVFGNGNRPQVGLDVLATKVAVDFQGLSSEGGDGCVKRNLDALREATGVDALCIALFDLDKKIVERVASATALLTPFDPQVMKGDSLERLPMLASGSSTCASSRSATRSRRAATWRSMPPGSPNSACARCLSAASR